MQQTKAFRTTATPAPGSMQPDGSYHELNVSNARIEQVFGPAPIEAIEPDMLPVTEASILWLDRGTNPILQVACTIEGEGNWPCTWCEAENEYDPM